MPTSKLGRLSSQLPELGPREVAAGPTQQVAKAWRTLGQPLMAFAQFVIILPGSLKVRVCCRSRPPHLSCLG